MARILNTSWGTFHFIMGGLLLLAAGCGGGNEQVVQQAPSAQNSASPSRGKAPKLTSIRSDSKAKTPVKRKQSVLEGNPEDFFEVVDYVHNYQIQKPGSVSDADEQVAVVLPTQKELILRRFPLSNLRLRTSREPLILHLHCLKVLRL